MSNLIILKQRGEMLLQELRGQGFTGALVNNGTYVHPADKMMPGMLAAFQYSADRVDDKTMPLLIAINSDESMQRLMDEKISKGSATPADRHNVESEITRAVKVANPLSFQFPNRQIFVVFYDEPTPNALYKSLAEKFGKTKSLFKMGYGTNPNEGIIEGGEFFDVVYAHPLPSDTRPICHDLTKREGQQGTVEIIDLRTLIGPHGKPYLNDAGECLFPLSHPALFQYRQRPERINVNKPTDLAKS